MIKPERLVMDSRKVTDERVRLLRAAVERRLEERRERRDAEAAVLGR